MAFHDVNPVKSIDGSRNAFYLAISCSSSVWKDVKSNEFNLKYNKNRVKLNIYQKINKFFFKYFLMNSSKISLDDWLTSNKIPFRKDYEIKYSSWIKERRNY